MKMSGKYFTECVHFLMTLDAFLPAEQKQTEPSVI